MCDTLIATRLASADGIAVFGKNSDRPPNEGQHLAYFPAQTHPAGSKVKCTYIEIPQVEKTHAILLSKPYWMWGAEIGINEHGLVIGNEAVFSKIPANKKPALLGMDLLRAALERSVTAREALQVIIDLLEEFGQGGNCDSDGGEMYYHNSFIIADAHDAWVLETVDRQWAARQVKDVYSISNCLTLGSEYDLVSSNLVDLAIQKGFARSKPQFNFARDYSDFIFTTGSRGRGRHNTTSSTLEGQKGKITVQSMLQILRTHDSSENPQAGLFPSVCSHASLPPTRSSGQSTASMVAYLDGNTPLIFATGTSAPCTSVFKPIWMDAGLPDLGTLPTAHYDASSLFWMHERLHRATIINYPERIKTYADDRDALEKKFIEGAFKLKGAAVEERRSFTEACFRQAAQAEIEWLNRVEQIPARPHLLHSIGWNNFNQKAKMPTIK